jgi:hypothetical protein
MSTAGRYLREIFQCHVYCIEGKADGLFCFVVLLSTFGAITDKFSDNLV